MKKSWIQIGTVGKAQGLRGAFFISQRDEPPPAKLSKIRIGDHPDRAQELTLSHSFLSGDRWVLQCSELKTRQSAEQLKMQTIWCHRDCLDVMDAAEYLWADLVGKIILDPQKQYFARIVEVSNFGASDIVRVIREDGSRTEIPFVASYFDMSFSNDSKEISLVVAADTFADTWNLP